MGEYKTPGVYIKEKNAFGNSVVEAETAIPAFIGYTETTQNGAKINHPQKISSMTEFVKYFGGAPKLGFDVDIKKYYYLSDEQSKDGKTLAVTLKEPAPGIFKYCVCPSKEFGKVKFNDNKVGTEVGEDGDVTLIGYAFCVDGCNPYTLYYNMILFFANGGSTCYVVSVGQYSDNKPQIVANDLIAGIEPLERVSEITMVVIPEAVNIKDESQYKNIHVRMLEHCGYTMKNRFALLDIYAQAKGTTTTQVDVFKNGVGSDYLSYGAAYFPWLNTSGLSERDLNSEMFSWDVSVHNNVSKITEDPNFSNIVNAYYSNTIELVDGEEKTVNGITFKFNEEIKDGEVNDKNDNKTLLYTISEYKEQKNDKEVVISKTFIVNWPTPTNKNELYAALSSSSPLFKQAIKAILSKLNLLPPSAAMAGIYTMVDNTRGVWKAPANVSLNYVNSPSVDIDDDEQADLNAPMDGKAVNVIRTFRGEGVKVWGARTLDGNSLDWRYVNVRRTLLFLEESVKNAARAYVFEPNDASTWINMKCMIESFLRSVWKRGGLAGATPEDAFEVHVGLGDTMTGEDILEGIMRISVLVAVSHPAEFIEITFQQQMQKS